MIQSLAAPIHSTEEEGQCGFSSRVAMRRNCFRASIVKAAFAPVGREVYERWVKEL